MRLWLLLVLTFIVQEPISTSAVLLQAYQDHYNVWLIHLLFVAATVFDILVTYYLGVFIQKRFGNRRISLWLKKKLEQFSSFIGEKGRVVALIVYAPMLFPVSGFFIPWLDIPLGQALPYLFIGETIFWYLYVWLLVLGVRSVTSNAQSALYLILIVGAAVALSAKYFSRRPAKKDGA